MDFAKMLEREKESETERVPEYLAVYRPNNAGEKVYKGIFMTPEEIAQRRMYMRKKLRESRWQNLNNDELDKSLYFELDGRGMFEDSKGYCYILSSTLKTEKDMEFRKVRAMIPFEYKGLRTRDFKWNVYPGDTSDVRETLNRYLMNFDTMQKKGMGLYIYSGTKGSGKTMLSCCILNELAGKYAISVKFVNVLDLLDMTKKSYSSDNYELSAIYNASVLVLDDIGTQMSREWIDTVFYQLINRRYVEHKIILYTSNVRLDDLKMDDRIKDRIEATSYMVNLPEVPVRKNKSIEAKQQILEELKNAPDSAATPSKGE